MHWRHQWEPISTQWGEFTFVKGAGTIVLYRCRVCSNTKTESVNGHWTLAQLTGQEERRSDPVPRRPNPIKRQARP